MVLIFNTSGEFVLAQKKANKFYQDNDEFVIETVEDYDSLYLYSYENGAVIKGAEIVMSDEDIADFENHLTATAHVEPRMLAYPNISEQLDKLFHDIDNGTLDKDGDFYTSIKAVKDANPKTIKQLNN